MVARTVAALAISATVAPAAFLPPPLYSGASTSVKYDEERMHVSQIGLGGRVLYVDNCAVCHGLRGVGTEYGPALTSRIYWKDRLPQREFHGALHEPLHAGARGNRAGKPLGKLHFNDIELIARYVHEIQQPNRLK